MTDLIIYPDNKHPSFYENFPHLATKYDEGYTPYVYQISWTILNVHYIGVSFRRGCHPSMFWNKAIGGRGYFTSSELVKEYCHNHGDPDEITIRRVFDNMDDAQRYEHELLVNANAAKNPNFLNLVNGGIPRGIINLGQKVVKDRMTGRCYYVTVDEYNNNKDKYATPMTGRVAVFDTETKERAVISTDEYVNNRGRYRSHKQGTLVVTEISNNRPITISTDEYTINPHLYSYHASGMATVRELATGRMMCIPMEDYRENRGILYESIMHGRTNVYSIERDEWICIDSSEYQANNHLYKTQSDFGIAVIDRATGESTKITKEEYHANKHLYKSHSENKVKVFEIATGQTITLDRDHFLSNRHLYRTSVEGKKSHKSGKKSYVNQQGNVTFFILGEAPPGWEQCQVLYSMDDGDAKMRPIRLKTEQPDKFHSGSNVFDLECLEIRYLPKVIYSSDPNRYVSLRSPKYKEFKANQK